MRAIKFIRTPQLLACPLRGLVPKKSITSVFFYSVFYVFYEQYLTMWSDTLKSVSISLLTIFLVTFVLMGLNMTAAFVTVLTISMIITDIGGLMYLWGVSLNAVSLVNLVMVSITAHFVFK